MGFYERYELLELDRDDGVKTFQAREIPTGRPVKVHLFSAPRAPYQAQLLKKLEQLPATERSRILDRGNHLGTRYVVTDRLVDHKGLFEWISESLKPPGAKPAASDAKVVHAKPIDDRPVAGNVIDKNPPPPAHGPVSFVLPPRPGAPVPDATPPGAASPGEKDLNREFADLFKTTERPVFVLPPGSELRPSQSPDRSSPANKSAQFPTGEALPGKTRGHERETSQVSAFAKRMNLILFAGILALMIAAIWIGMLLARRLH